MKNTKERILIEATKLIHEVGVEKLSMRKLAAEIGIKAPSLYEHYKNKDAIMTALRQQAVEALSNLMIKASNEDPWSELQGQGLAYLIFASDMKMLFHLFFFETESTRTNIHSTPDIGSPYLIIFNSFQKAKPDFSSLAIEEFSLGYWALVHGLATLRITHLNNFQMDWEASQTRIIQTYLNGVRYGEQAH